MQTSKVIAEYLKKQFGEIPSTALILGSGMIDLITIQKKVNYLDLGISAGNIKGHNGFFAVGKFGETPVFCASRIHFYESGNMDLVRIPFEVMHNLGIKNLILQTTVGGIDLMPGDVAIITGHINFTGQNPLVGLQPIKFIDMENFYNKSIIDKLKLECVFQEVNLKESTHMQFLGPNYETSSEIYMARLFGVKTMSMSMVYDALLACYFDFKAICFAVVANTAGDGQKLTHDVVLANVKNGEFALVKAITIAIKILNE
ncbi:MAG: purine-nucleoside phosphorylase [Clostridia bacterium]